MVHDPAIDTTRCATCGTPVARRWQLAAHHCLHCAQVRHQVRQLITWHWDDHGRSRPTDPAAALGDLWVARAAINELIRQTIPAALDEGWGWATVGQELRLDPRDARARYERSES